MSDTQQPRPRILLGIGLLMLAYLVGYGVARWAKILLDYPFLELSEPERFGGTQRMRVRHDIALAHDVYFESASWVRFQVAEPARFLFRPLCWVESECRTATEEWEVVPAPAPALAPLVGSSFETIIVPQPKLIFEPEDKSCEETS